MALVLSCFAGVGVLSPIDFNDDDANVWNANDDGNLDDDNVDNSNALRPVISLRNKY